MVVQHSLAYCSCMHTHVRVNVWFPNQSSEGSDIAKRTTYHWFAILQLIVIVIIKNTIFHHDLINKHISLENTNNSPLHLSQNMYKHVLKPYVYNTILMQLTLIKLIPIDIYAQYYNSLILFPPLLPQEICYGNCSWLVSSPTKFSK